MNHEITCHGISDSILLKGIVFTKIKVNFYESMHLQKSKDSAFLILEITYN